MNRVKKEITADKPRVVVLDMRFDQGGNYVKTARFMANLTHLTGSIKRLYIFTSAWTFSAGLVSVAITKQNSAGRAVLVGEQVGGRIRVLAEGGSLCLPQWRICLQ